MLVIGDPLLGMCSPIRIGKIPGPIASPSKRQTTVSLSSAEAEYRSMVEAGKGIMWIRQLLQELGAGPTYSIACGQPECDCNGRESSAASKGEAHRDPYAPHQVACLT
nr:hypothetical protein Q903MT_gene3106 [Picea sitchensis]